MTHEPSETVTVSKSVVADVERLVSVSSGASWLMLTYSAANPLISIDDGVPDAVMLTSLVPSDGMSPSRR